MIDLGCGAWYAAIDPERGAQVLRLRYNGQPVLREPESTAALAAEPVLYGMPFLFPPNRVTDGIFTFDGRAYHLPITEPARHNHIHGLFAGAAFRVEERGPDRLTTILDNSGEYFPFSCRVKMNDTLSGNGFYRETTIENTGSSDMPVEIGFHTTFAAPGKFLVPIDRRWETDDRIIPTGYLLPLNNEEQEIAAGNGPRGIHVSGFYTARGHMARIGKFKYHVSDDFTDWVLFSRDDEAWICVEPQSGPVNQLNCPDCRRLSPGKRLCLWQKIGLVQENEREGDNEG